MQDGSVVAERPGVQRWWRRHGAIWVLAALTLLGGALRFANLDHPSIWGDESMTYSRVSGSYQQMLDQLKNDGFPPLHYSAYWWLGQHVTLTPFWMRLIPAIAGTLMIPAMYALSRQFVGRRTSLLVALFTAVSAYLLVYSRDAKMYMHLWLFVVLHLTCLIVWMRTQSRLAWWGWIAAGIAMVGTSMTGAGVLAIDLLLLFTQREMRWWRTVFFVLGAGLIAAGPAYYYTQFNKWVDKVENNPRHTGITWVQSYNAERDGPGLVLYTTSAYLLSWEWAPPKSLPAVPVRVAWWLKAAVVTLLGLMALGLIPWRRTWMATRRGGIEAPWRSALWLAFLLVVPAYGFYCASVPDAFWPSQWLGWIGERPWALWTGAMLLVAWLAAIIARPANGARWLGQIVLVGVVVVGVLYAVRATVPTWHYSVWMPRYLGFVWPAFAIVVSILLMRLPTRALRIVAILLLVASNLAQFGARAFGPSEPPVDLAARDFVMDLSQKDTGMRAYQMTGDTHEGGGAPGTAGFASMPLKYYLDVFSGAKHTPVEIRQGINKYYKIRRASSTRALERDMMQTATLQRVIVWDRTLVNRPERPANLFGDGETPQGWRLVSFERYPVFDHWRWQRLSTWYRWEYARDVAAPTIN